MQRSPLSLKWLEAFQAVARHGSVQDGARDLGVSLSTVSHHLSCLEDMLGAPLLDHARRPMRLTQAGETLLRRVDEALWLLRQGVSDIWADDLGSFVRQIRIAHLEDFETDVAPAMLQSMVRAMPLCGFSVLTRAGHEVLDLLRSEQVDIGLAASTDQEMPGLVEHPFLRDPFLLILPAGQPDRLRPLEELQLCAPDLPLLRYSRNQLIGQRIEAQLRRQGVRFPARMEFESTHIILAMVAAGHGWAITSALTFARAQRYHASVQAAPFPGRAFARQISLFCREDVPPAIRSLAADSVRASAGQSIITPLVARYPWLGDQFRLIGKDGESVTT